MADRILTLLPDQESIARIKEAFGPHLTRKFNRVMYRSINRAGARLQKMILRRAAPELGVTQRRVRRRCFFLKATSKKLEAKVIAGSKGLSLAQGFGAVWEKPSPLPIGPTGKESFMFIPGVTFTHGPRINLPHAFIRRGRGGKIVVFSRGKKPTGSSGVSEYVAKSPRLPIWAQRTPSVASIIDKHNMSPDLQREAAALMQKRILAETNLILRGIRK